MDRTYLEIKDQYRALNRTLGYMTARCDELMDFYRRRQPRTLLYAGSGSSYCLCRSAALSAVLRLSIPALAFSAGDLMLNYESYRKTLDGAMLAALSRSGKTSELIKAIRNIRAYAQMPILAITCSGNTPLTDLADFKLEIPWADDKSVCQTRTVVNLYAANLIMLAYLSGDLDLLNDIKAMVCGGEVFMDRYDGILADMACMDWNNVVILADGEIQGIAAEGALAFTEIAQIPGHSHCFLDVRHGPLIMIKKGTLVIACLTENGFDYQKGLIEEIRDRGADVITYSDIVLDEIKGVKLAAASGMKLASAVRGIPFINIAQLLALYQAKRKGLNPDQPEGLDAWIALP
ncbi:MAG: SIS domain-containing protein [Bacillota bacterium]